MLPNLCPPSCHSLPAGPRSGGRFETSFDRVPGSRCVVQGLQYGVCEVEIRRHVRKQARFHETRVSDCVQVLRPCHRASTHSKGTILLRCVVLDFVVGCRNYCICKNCNAGFTCSAQFICVRWKHLTGSLVVHYTL